MGDLTSSKPPFRLLFITPEGVKGMLPHLRKVEEKGLLNLIAVDEVRATAAPGLLCGKRGRWGGGREPNR